MIKKSKGEKSEEKRKKKTNLMKIGDRKERKMKEGKKKLLHSPESNPVHYITPYILYRKLPAPSSSSAAFLVASSDCPPPPDPIIRDGMEGLTIGVFMLGKNGTVA
jgi:hypothetical protein